MGCEYSRLIDKIVLIVQNLQCIHKKVGYGKIITQSLPDFFGNRKRNNFYHPVTYIKSKNRLKESQKIIRHKSSTSPMHSMYLDKKSPSYYLKQQKAIMFSRISYDTTLKCFKTNEVSTSQTYSIGWTHEPQLSFVLCLLKQYWRVNYYHTQWPYLINRCQFSCSIYKIVFYS